MEIKYEKLSDSPFAVKKREKLTESKVEDILIDLINDVYHNDLGFCEVCSFEEKGILTTDKGIAISLQDGSEILLTIQGYNAEGRRMEE